MFGHSDAAVVKEYPSAQAKHRARREDGLDSQEPPPGVVGYSYHDNGYGKGEEVGCICYLFRSILSRQLFS